MIKGHVVCLELEAYTCCYESFSSETCFNETAYTVVAHSKRDRVYLICKFGAEA